YRHIKLVVQQPTLLAGCSIAAEILATFFATFFVLRLTSLGGKWCAKIFSSVLVLVSVASAYYMFMYNIIIGYGIIASVLTTT
ncbi:phosphoethanolamine transferase domain-containing protein, partial [Rosenbergiella nectarea]|uniref:phosphoethanolamine transferase domain-containing protein n=2 Tax=Rosenbergiella TaxID=1356488 RepID=UPI001F4F64FB